MHQIIEMKTSLMKERGVVESPNSQEESDDNQKVGHPDRSKFISHHAEINPFVRQLVSQELNSRANPTDLVDVSNLNHPLYGC